MDETDQWPKQLDSDLSKERKTLSRMWKSRSILPSGRTDHLCLSEVSKVGGKRDDFIRLSCLADPQELSARVSEGASDSPSEKL